MDSLLQTAKKDKGSNKILLIGLVAGVLIVAAAIGLLSLRPSIKEVEHQALESAFREGTPEFERYTKKIIAQTDENRTMQSPTAMGTITMSIGGIIRNFTGQTLTGLELKVGVVDTFGNLLREKTLIVIPKQVESLENNQTMPVQVVIEGFERNSDRANIRWKVTAIKVE